jgi:CheY-like chemotaxis protein
LLGQLLLAEGFVTSDELAAALARQEENGERLGQILIDAGALAPRQLERALRRQARLRGEPTGSEPFILVVDDDPEVGAVVGEILASAGYRVGIAQSEAEALWATLAPDRETPKLVVLDLGLPEHGGVEVLTVLRKNGSTSDTPVIVLTGHPERESELRERGLSVSQFLTKPTSPRELVAAVETALSPVLSE